MTDFLGWSNYAVAVFAVLLITIRSRNLLFGFLAFSGIRIFMAPVSPYAGESVQWQTSLDMHAATSLAIGMILYTASRYLTSFFWVTVAVINTVLLLLPPHWGVLFNPSMSGCFQVCLYAYLGNFWMALPVLILPASQPLGLLVLVGILQLGLSRKNLVGVGLLVVSSLLAMVLQGAELTSTNGRFEVWKVASNFWISHVEPLFGAGIGSFKVIGPYLTRGFVSKFSFLHSDWLTFLFETGMIGLSLAISYAFFRIVQVKKNKRLFISHLAVAGFMIANMPLQYPLSMLFIFWLLRR